MAYLSSDQASEKYLSTQNLALSATWGMPKVMASEMTSIFGKYGDESKYDLNDDSTGQCTATYQDMLNAYYQELKLTSQDSEYRPLLNMHNSGARAIFDYDADDNGSYETTYTFDFDENERLQTFRHMISAEDYGDKYRVIGYLEQGKDEHGKEYMRATCDNRPLGGTQRMDYDNIGTPSFRVFDNEINTKMHTVEADEISYDSNGNVTDVAQIKLFQDLFLK